MNASPQLSRLGLLALLFPLLFTAAAATTQAAPPPPQTLVRLKSEWWAERDPATLPRILLRDASGVDVQAPEAGDALEDVSRIAYQSLRSGAWEVYLARGDGRQSQRLTNGGENTSPSLNRGATHVAFSSRRDGDQELYSLRTDGADLRRLTTSSGDDSWAAWSPDSQRIAFASTRNFGWDIFVMNADGSDQTRLTPTATDDVSPTWSPDGQRIAWVQRDGDHGTLMVMNADGSESRPLAPAMRYLENPSWSPNGDFIAFDADVDNDYWTELLTYRLSTGELHRLYDSWQSGIDFWMGSWSPDGGFLAFNHIDYGISNGELVITNSFIQRIGASGGFGENLISSGYDFFPNWQATDIAPPEVRYIPLPRYVKVNVSSALLIEWEGWDNGPAGIRDYLPQVWREPAQRWESLSTTTQTRMYFSWQGEANHTYAFRVRARDYAGNLSAWAGDSDDLFTPYLWRLDGRVHDTRGIYLDAATIQRNPDTPDPSTTTPDGRFQVHVSYWAQPTQAVSVSKPGYAQMPAQTFNSFNYWVDRRYWWDLRTDGNRIVNGDFEPGSLAAWRISGTAQVVLDETDPHQGLFSASMGYPVALPITRLSAIDPNGTDSYSPPRIARDALANLHVVWAEAGRGVFYALKTPDTNWSAPALLAPTGWMPEIAVTPDGAVHITFNDNSPAGFETLVSIYKAPESGWSLPVTIFTNPGLIGIGQPSLAADGMGNVHSVWSAGSVWHAVLPAHGSWSAPVRIFPDGGFPVVAPGPENELHLVFRSNTDPYPLLYSRLDAGGSWSSAEQIPNSDGYDIPDLAADQTGGLHLVTNHQGAAVYIAHPSGGDWQPPEPLGEDPAIWITGFAVAPAPDGAVHFLYILRDTPNNLWSKAYHRVRTPDGDWSAPFELAPSLSGYAGGPDLVTDDQSRTRAVWFNNGYYNGADDGVFYALINPRRTYRAAMEQTIDLSGLHAPTLSFAYKLDAHEDVMGASLSATIDGVAVFSTTHPATEWTHGWTDLSPWAGQNVTVSFFTQSTADSGPILANVDGVSVSAWLTPLIRRITPSYLPSQTATPITIHGENFIAPVSLIIDATRLPVQRIDDQTLSATLPATLPPGSYDVQVANASGQSYKLRGGLRLGRQVFLPALQQEH